MKPRPRKDAVRIWASRLIILGLICIMSGCGWAARTTEDVVGFFKSSDANITKLIALVPPETAIKDLEPQTQQFARAFREGLAKIPGLKLVSFAELNQRIAKLPASIRNPMDKVVAAGRLMGLNAVTAVQITDLSVQSRLDGLIGFRENTSFLGLEAELRIFDVASGTVLAQTSLRPERELDPIVARNISLGKKPPAKIVSALATELSKRALRWLAQAVSAQPWAGFILAVDGSRVRITVGRDIGLGEGSTLMVHGRGEKLRSGAGTILHVPGPPLARLRIIKFDGNSAWAQVTPLGGKDQEKVKLEPGMVVRTD